MGYETNWALVVKSDIVDEFLGAVKDNKDIPNFYFDAADRIVKSEDGDLLFVSEMKHFGELKDNLLPVLEGIDVDGETWLLNWYGEEYSDIDHMGNYRDDPFEVFVERSWHVNKNGSSDITKIEWPSAITAMARAIKDAKKD